MLKCHSEFVFQKWKQRDNISIWMVYFKFESYVLLELIKHHNRTVLSSQSIPKKLKIHFYFTQSSLQTCKGIPKL